MLRGDDEPVTVIGGGIAGLVTALSLAHFGFRVAVFEQSAVLREVGAGLQLSPNALRVLARLGLLDALRRTAVEARAVTLRSGRSGHRIATIPVASPDGLPYLSIHRADLQSALVEAAQRTAAVSLHLGTRLLACSPAGSTSELRFQTDAGTFTRSTQLVVGADGVRSVVARSLGAPAAVPSGMAAWRATTPADGESARGIEAWLGARRHAVTYPVRAGSETNIVLVVKEAEAHASDEVGATPQVLRTLRGWDGRLLSLLARATPLGTWPLLITPPRRPWTFGGSACLVGDAAHAMLPYAAQGAAMAIEDGWVLAHALSASEPIGEALQRFAAARRSRMRRVRARVALHALVYHLPPPFSSLRDAALRSRSPTALRHSLAWLYDWQPPDG